MGYLSPPPSPAPVVVYKDVGGLVSEYQAQTEIYRREAREVRLHECRSACTLALSLPNVCVYPDAQVKFHQAYNAINRETDAGVSAQLFDSYPAAVRERLGHLTRQYKVLSGTELIALGVRNCNDGPTMIASAGRRQNPQPSGAADPLSELAETVQGAVAKAFGTPDGVPQSPIRVAVIDRRLQTSAAVQIDATPVGTLPPRPPADLRLEAEGGGLPQPPRRPPSLAFAAEDAPEPYRLLIPGAQPILPSARFSPTLAARIE